MRIITRIVLFAIPITWYIGVRWAAKSNQWAADYWWLSSLVVTAICYATYRFLQARAQRSTSPNSR
jgi:hypothetical protein